MDIRQLRYFATVAEELHFGRAAKRLNISQPPLSQQIRALEEEIGVQLLNRTTQSVRLTESGKVVLVDVYRLLEQFEQIKVNARRVSAEAGVRLRVGAISTLMMGVLPEVLRQFRRQQPDIDISLHEVDTEGGIALLRKGELEVALVRPEHSTAEFRSASLGTDHFVAAVPEDHPLAARRDIDLLKLKDEPLIVLSRQMLPRPYDTIVSACLQAGFTPNLAIHSPTVRSQIASVRCGLGIALVPSSLRASPVPGVVYKTIADLVTLPGVAMLWAADNPRWHLDALLAGLRSRLNAGVGGLRKKKMPARSGPKAA